MWHMVGGGGEHFSKFQLTCSYGLGNTLSWTNGSLNQWIIKWISNEGDFWTAPATLGLLIIYRCIVAFYSFFAWFV